MSMSSARSDQKLYCLMLTQPSGNVHFWLPTLATNRRDSWLVGKRYSKDPNGNWKLELKREGFSCVCVRIRLETIPAPKFS